MKRIYSAKAFACIALLFIVLNSNAQVPTNTQPGICPGVVANFNTNDNGFNSPSIYADIFDSAFYYNASRGYWTDYLPPTRTAAPGFVRRMNIISPPFTNPNQVGTFNVGFYYIVNNPQVDKFFIRIISVTQTPQGTVTNVEATSGLKTFADFSTPTPYIDGTTRPVPDPTPLLNGFEGTVCIRLIDPDITNGPNTTYRVEVTYVINEAYFAVFDNLSIGALNIPLPVNFIGLVANRGNNKTVNVRWDVGDETNVKEYQVERSTNGSFYTAAGVVEAKENPVYGFTDKEVTSATVFYRIKSVDHDGRAKYSGVIRLAGNSSNSFGDKMLVYPVPAKDDIMIEHKQLNNRARIMITTLDGKVMRIITPTQGSSHTPVNVSYLARGVYVIKLDDGDGYGTSTKLIKQ